MTVDVQAALAAPDRVAVLRRFNTAPPAGFDRLARLASVVMDTRIGIVNLVRDEQCFAGAVGLAQGWRSMPLDEGFCPHVVASGEPLLVPDTALSTFAAEPVVTQTGVRAYAGVPLAVDHTVVGTVCVLDTRPHPWTDDHMDRLGDVAAAAVTELRAELLAGERVRLGEAFADAPCPIAVTSGASHRLVYTNRAFRVLARHDNTQGPNTPEGQLWLPGPDQARLRAAVEAAYHDGRPSTEVVRVPEVAGRRVRTLTFTVAPRRSPSGNSIDGVVVTGTDTTEQAAAAERLRQAAQTFQRGLAPQVGEEPVVAEVAATRPPRWMAPPRRRVTDPRPADPQVPDRRPPADDPPTAPIPIIRADPKTGNFPHAGSETPTCTEANAGGGLPLAGGPCSEVMALSPGRVAVVVAAVPGEGVDAAVMTGHLRTAIRTAGAFDADPADALARLDRLVAQAAGDLQACCLYAVYDAAEGSLAWASAGTPPPLRGHPNGTVDLLQGEVGSPLGVADPRPYITHHARLALGETLALFTDTRPPNVSRAPAQAGTAEAGTAEAARLAEVVRACLEEPHADLDATLAHIHAFHGPPVGNGGVVLLRVPTTPEYEVRAHALPNAPSSAAAARRVVREVLAAWRMREEVIEAAEMIASELVGNAATHARHAPAPDGEAPIGLRLHRTSTSVGIEAMDHHPALPRPRHTDPLGEHGRGLHLINRLATRWGHRPLADGKVVWTELVFTTRPIQATVPGLGVAR